MSRNTDGTYTGYIYLITNLINGKHYVGQTTTTIEHRWGQHKTDYNNPNPMYKAFQKYGLENFRIDEISHYTRNTLDKLLKILNSKEIYYINKYQSLVTQNGYNLSIGGNNRGIYNCFPIDVYNRDGELLYECCSATETSRLLNYDVSSILNCCKGESVPEIDYIFRFKNHPFDEFSIKRNRTSKIVFQFDIITQSLINKYSSLVDAANNINGSVSGLSGALCKRRKTYKGYYWNTVNLFDYIPPKEHCIKIDKYDLDGNFIDRYNSAVKAQESVGATNSHSIISVCKGKTTTAFGFVWRYAGDSYDKFSNIIDLKNNNFSYGKAVDMYTIDGVFECSFSSMREAQNKTNILASNISACCRGKAVSAMNHIFRFHGDNLDKYHISSKNQKQPVCIYDINGKLLYEFKSKNQASKELNINYHLVENLCNGKDKHIYDNKIFLYKNDDILQFCE